MKFTTIGVAFLVSLTIAAAPLFSQQKDASELAKATQNPIADLISVPFQNNVNFGVGPANKVQNILNIQPVLPLSLKKDSNLIMRTIVPVVSQPALSPAEDPTNGLGDMTGENVWSTDRKL